MVVKKLTSFNPESLPEEVKKNLNLLVRPKPEIVVIGQSYYELHPIPAIKFLEVLKELFSVVDKLKEKKRKALSLLSEDGDKTKLMNVNITLNDILEDEETYNTIINILKNKILEGVDEDDFNQMTTPQFIYLIQKVFEVNLNNLPPVFKERLNQTNAEIFLKQQTQ
jgi:hypothetical protein